MPFCRGTARFTLRLLLWWTVGRGACLASPGLALPRAWLRRALGSAVRLAPPCAWLRRALGSAVRLAPPCAWLRRALGSAVRLAPPCAWLRRALGSAVRHAFWVRAQAAARSRLSPRMSERAREEEQASKTAGEPPQEHVEDVRLAVRRQKGIAARRPCSSEARCHPSPRRPFVGALRAAHPERAAHSTEAGL